MARKRLTKKRTPKNAIKNPQDYARAECEDVFYKEWQTCSFTADDGEFKNILESNPLPSSFSTHATPQLVGKKISHRFYDKKKKECKWYTGLVMSYDDERNEYEVAYADEEQHSFLTY